MDDVQGEIGNREVWLTETNGQDQTHFEYVINTFTYWHAAYPGWTKIFPFVLHDTATFNYFSLTDSSWNFNDMGEYYQSSIAMFVCS